MKCRYFLLPLMGAYLFSVAAMADTIAYTGSVQQFTAPTTGVYDILAFAASGGNGFGTDGGLGAEIGGDFTLTAGEILDVYVGEAGQSGNNTGGGGGGTFVVVDSTTAPLVIAGGGGGGSDSAGQGQPGSTSVVNGGAGGSSVGAGGGGGFSSSSNAGIFAADFPNIGGGGFPNLAGGFGDDPGIAGNGGYGGGGGGTDGCGGGGGGYGGGDGGITSDCVGAGGGSYLDASVINALMQSGENSGNGMVTIAPVAAAVPEPRSLSLLVLVLIAIAGLRRPGGRGAIWSREYSRQCEDQESFSSST